MPRVLAYSRPSQTSTLWTRTRAPSTFHILIYFLKSLLGKKNRVGMNTLRVHAATLCSSTLLSEACIQTYNHICPATNFSRVQNERGKRENLLTGMRDHGDGSHQNRVGIFGEGNRILSRRIRAFLGLERRTALASQGGTFERRLSQDY